MQLTVAEEVDDGGPDGVGGGAGNTDDAHDIARNGVVDPVDQALVDHDPVQVSALNGGWGVGDVRVETKLADDGIKETPPLLVVRIDDVEDHRDMGFDVDCLKGRCGGGGARRSPSSNGAV